MGTPAFAVPTLEALHHKGHEILAVFMQQAIIIADRKL